MDAETTVMIQALRIPLTQRADYTQKHNAKTGRYGWLRLTPAYSLKVVNEILGAYDDDSGMHVFDRILRHGHHGVVCDVSWSVGRNNGYNPLSCLAEPGEDGLLPDSVDR